MTGTGMSAGALTVGLIDSLSPEASHDVDEVDVVAATTQ